jgi:hypothetical protein
MLDPNPYASPNSSSPSDWDNSLFWRVVKIFMLTAVVIGLCDIILVVNHYRLNSGAQENIPFMKGTALEEVERLFVKD